MSVDYTRSSDGETPQDPESPMFAPTPMWDRSKKKNREKVSGERRSFFDRDDSTDETPAVGASALAAEPMVETPATRETAVGPTEDDTPLMAPAARTTTVRRERNVAPIAIGVGLIALAALAAAGWYATQPSDKTLTPGDTAPATTIAAAPAPSAGDATLAANAPPANAAAAPAETTTTTTHHVATTTTRAAAPAVRRSTRTAMAASPERSVTSRNATESGVNTRDTTSVGVVPSAPVTAAPPPAASTPTPPPVNTMPTPAPAPSTTTPDVTPPAASSAPTTTPPPQ